MKTELGQISESLFTPDIFNVINSFIRDLWVGKFPRHPNRLEQGLTLRRSCTGGSRDLASGPTNSTALEQNREMGQEDGGVSSQPLDMNQCSKVVALPLGIYP